MSAQPKIEAVAFDCDGLMFNTEESFNVAGRQLLQRRGHELTPQILQVMMGRRAVDAFAALVEFLQVDESPDAMRAEYQQLFLAALEGRLAAMPGLFELLASIEHAGLPAAVCTSSERDYLDRMLAHFDLSTRFQTTLTANDVERGKPHPEIYLTAAERLGIRPENLLVLEDSENGTRAAVAAGAVAVSVPHEHSLLQDFTGAWLIATGLDDPRISALLVSEASERIPVSTFRGSL